MKRTRLSESQIVAILNQADAGIKVKELCREHGISDATYYNWKARYGWLFKGTFFFFYMPSPYIA